MNKTTLVCFLTLLLIALIGGCGSPTKLQRVETEQMSARLALSRNEIAEERRVIASAPRDTITVTGCIIMSVIMISVIQLIVDITYAFVDPRLKSQYSRSGRRRKTGGSLKGVKANG